MFELEYKITDGDVKSINKKISLFYFALYIAVAAVGIAVGAIAVAIGPSKLMFVLGIILLALGGVLALCALMILIAPKNFVASAIKPSDDALSVHIDESGIAVVSANEDMKIPFASVTEVRDKKEYLLVFVGKDVALIVKNAFTVGGGLAELFKFLSARRGGLVNPAAVATPESDGEKTNAYESGNAAGASENDDAEAEDGRGGDTDSNA